MEVLWWLIDHAHYIVFGGLAVLFIFGSKIVRWIEKS